MMEIDLLNPSEQTAKTNSRDLFHRLDVLDGKTDGKISKGKSVFVQKRAIQISIVK